MVVIMRCGDVMYDLTVGAGGDGFPPMLVAGIMVKSRSS